MNSNDILRQFRIIELKDAISYLTDSRLLYSGLYGVVQQFVALPEDQMSCYKFPRVVGERKQEIIDHYGKNSDDYKQFNTVLTGISLIVCCAQINQAIRALYSKYKQKEDKYRFTSSYSSYYNVPNWSLSKDPDVLSIKYTAITARDEIHGYSRKYTVDDFEKDFIDKVKIGVYDICFVFSIDTQSLGEKIEDASWNIGAGVVVYGIIFLLFFLMATCAINH